MFVNIKSILQTFATDALTLVLLGGLLAVPAGAVISAGWTEGLIVLLPVVLTAMLAGYILSISKFSDGMTIIIGMTFGAFTAWVVGALSMLETQGWSGAFLGVISRIATWTEQASSGGFSRDNLVFVVVLSCIFWVLGLNAALNIFRARHLWPASIPPGLALLINNYYYTGTNSLDIFLVGYLFLTFTLAVSTNAIYRAEMWREKGMGYSGTAQIDLLRGGLIGVIALLAIAWSAPAASASTRLAGLWDRSSNPWNDVQDTWTRLFGGLDTGASTPDYYGGTTLSMGGPVNLGSNTVMLVAAPSGYRYYWRSKVFDTYRDGQWATVSDSRIDSDYGVLPNEEANPPALRQNVQQRFVVVIPATRLVYAAPDPISFGTMPLNFDIIYNDGFGKQIGTVTSVRSRTPLRQGRTYDVTSAMSKADQTSLRLAGTDYPLWVTQRYLSVPLSVTPRTRDLAVALTANADNPYDKTRAIEAYLRVTMSYDTQVPPPPQGVDPVDYFLFESQRGYCNYYSSSMVLMLRMVGIPARVAAGFAQGQFDPAVGAFRVKESDAHSWVEAYFPRFGWIEFEPTAAMEPIVRPEFVPGGDPLAPETGGLGDPQAAIAATSVPEGVQPPQEDAGIVGVSSIGALAAGIPLIFWCAFSLALAGMVIAGGAWAWVEFFDLRGLNDIQRAYARMNIAARWMGLHLDDTLTPQERGGLVKAFVPAGEASVDRIVGLYVQDRYGPPFAPSAETHRGRAAARSAWERLWRMMLKSWISGWLGRLNLQPLRDRPDPTSQP